MYLWNNLHFIHPYSLKCVDLHLWNVSQVLKLFANFGIMERSSPMVDLEGTDLVIKNATTGDW